MVEKVALRSGSAALTSEHHGCLVAGSVEARKSMKILSPSLSGRACAEAGTSKLS